MMTVMMIGHMADSLSVESAQADLLLRRRRTALTRI